MSTRAFAQRSAKAQPLPISPHVGVCSPGRLHVHGASAPTSSPRAPHLLNGNTPEEEQFDDVDDEVSGPNSDVVG
eukprot:4738355-Heterocapsa_arctica.AAC.2